MKNKLTIFLVTILVVIVILFIQRQGVNNLVSSDFSKDTTQTINQVPNATPNAPKTYNFNSATDLEKELDSINPEVLDSDFEG